MVRDQEDQMSRFLHELRSVLVALLRSPELAIPPSSPSSPGAGGVGPPELPHHAPAPLSWRLTWPQASPVALASLMLGASMALMLGGSVTFVLGFMLMPWVLGMLAVLYLAGIVSSLSSWGRAILFPSAPKEDKGKLLSKLPTD